MSAERTLLDQIRVRPTGAATFGSELTAVPFGRAFGGQLIAQTLLAGAATAAEYPFPTSLHAYFVKAASGGEQVSYQVETTRDGGRFAWRRVVASQFGHVVLDALMCFQRHPTPALTAPAAPPPIDPESLATTDEVIAAAEPDLDWFFRRHGDLAFEVRYPGVPPTMRVAAGDRTPEQDVWLRALVPASMSPAEHGAVLAFLSDVNLVATPFIVLGRTGLREDTSGASFDHQIQFHSSDQPMDEWLFYKQSTDVLVEGAISASGRLMSRDGLVLVSAHQNGVASA